MTGAIVASRRRSLGWTQQRLADELGCSLAAVKSWEYGYRNPPHYVDLAMRYLRAKAVAERSDRRAAS